MGNPSEKSNQGCAEIAFHPVGKHGGDHLVRANYLKHFFRGKDVGTGRRTDQVMVMLFANINDSW